MPKSMDEHLADILKEFNLSTSSVAEGFKFLYESTIDQSSINVAPLNAPANNLFEEKLVPELFKDCLADPERPDRESILELSALYQDGCIERSVPNDLFPVLAGAVMVRSISAAREAATIWERPETTAKEFVRAGKNLGLLPADCDYLFERAAYRVCELKDGIYAGVQVRPLKLEVGIPFEELRDRILGRLSPELCSALEVEYKRQNAFVIPVELKHPHTLPLELEQEQTHSWGGISI